MVRWVEALLALQGVDLKIRNMKARLAMLTPEREGLQKQIDAAKKIVSNMKVQTRQTENLIKNNENEIKKLFDTNLKLQQRTPSIRKNEEYQALLLEIEHNRLAISDLEGETILLMERLDSENAKLKELTREEQGVIANVEAELKELAELEKELKEIIVEEEAKRAPCEKKIEFSIIGNYERLLSRNAGDPLVKVENGICGNCHLRVVPQTMNLIKRGAVAYCDNCSHLIYLEGVEE